MPFTVRDFQDLVRLLEAHPEWRAELRRLLLTDDILALPGIVRRLAEAQERTEAQLAQLVEAQRQSAEAQRRTDERLAELAAAQARTEERLQRLETTVAQLVAAQQHTEERLQRLETTVAQLVEAQRRTDERLAELAAAQARTEERLQRLETTVAQLVEAQRRTDERLAELAAAQARTEERLQRLIDTVGDMRGTLLEYRYRERAVAYFGPYLRRVRPVPLQELEDTLEQQLSTEELNELFQLDLLVRGRPRYLPEAPEVWLAIEVSAVVDAEDVARARRRAALLSRAGYLAVPVVAGEGATQGAQEEAQTHQVVLLQDGRTLHWDEALAAWLRRSEPPG